MNFGIFERSLGDFSVRTNLQTVALVQRHLLALGIIPPGTSVQVSVRGKWQCRCYLKRGREELLHPLVETKLFYLWPVCVPGWGDNGIYFLELVF